MSILIKGMDMPTNCDVCFLPLQYCPYAMKPNGSCPLVEIPPHGRLIDADASIDVAEGHVSPRQTTIAAFLLNHIYGPAPRVVIPAEEGE